MAVTTATLTWAGLALTAVGTGVSAYSQYQAGKAQSAIAQFNAKQHERNTRLQLMAAQASSAAQKRQAEAQFFLAQQEATARFNNAVSLENQALGQDRINRENLRRRREEFGRMQATQRAAIAASGIVESSGSPLGLIAETAGAIQRDQDEQAYGFELQRRTIFREAEMERLGGKFALAGASLDRSSSLAASELTAAEGRMRYLGGLREAQIMRMTGAADRRAGSIAAGATLISGAGDLALGTGRGAERYGWFQTS